MVVTSLLLTAALSSSLAAQAEESVSRPVSAAVDQRAPSAERQGERAQPPTDRPHQAGIGPSISGGSGGVGGAMRFFFNDRVGIDFVASWYNPQTRNATGGTVNVAPSLHVMLRRRNDQASVDLRPYAGGGLNYVYSSYHAVSTPYSGSAGGIGGQVYGGVEMTFHDASWVTISGEARYYSLPVQTVNVGVMDGMNYGMVIHFYMR